MEKKLIHLIFLLLIGTPASPQLVFQSGFEDSCKIIPYGTSNDKIVGKDLTLSTNNDWDVFEKTVSSSKFYINYTGGTSAQRYARIIPEPGNSLNKVLQFKIIEPWLVSENQEKARVQCDWYGIKGGYKEFYQSVRVFLHTDFNLLKNYPKSISWLTLSEFWNNEWWVTGEPYGFRVTLGIGKPSSAVSELNFILNAENAGQIEVWKGQNTSVKVPIGKWFTMEYYFKEGNNLTGRFYMAITPDGGARQVVFDITNYTHNTSDPSPNGLTGYNPMKLYTSAELVNYMKSNGKSLQVYWDDFRLWLNKKPVTTTGIVEDKNNAADFVIYPNPAAQQALVSYRLPESSPVKIVLHDLLGKEIMLLVNESQLSGEHIVPVNLDRLQNGIYFVKLNVSGEQVTKKLIVNK